MCNPLLNRIFLRVCVVARLVFSCTDLFGWRSCGCLGNNNIRTLIQAVAERCLAVLLTLLLLRTCAPSLRAGFSGAHPIWSTFRALGHVILSSRLAPRNIAINQGHNYYHQMLLQCTIPSEAQAQGVPKMRPSPCKKCDRTCKLQHFMLKYT